MKRLLLILALLTPLTVTIAATQDIQVPVTEFAWSHDGVNTAGYKIYCDGAVVMTVTDPTKRAVPIPPLPAGQNLCYLTAYNTVTAGTQSYVIESPHSETADFFTAGATHYRIVTASVPAAPASFGVR